MTIDELIQNFYLQKQQCEVDIENYDKEFSDKKLNPYGVTTIEFEKRSDAFKRKSQLEGAIDALFMVKRDIMGDDGEVNMPSFELATEEDDNIETIGQRTED